MAFSLNFDKRLKQALDALKIKGVDRWECGWPVDERSKVDVVGIEGKRPRVFVEVELKKDNPVENVVKVWRWALHTGNTDRILFVHAFSGLYDLTNAKRPPSKAKQYERAVFIGERMKKDYGSHNVDYEHRPIYTTTRSGKLIQYKPRLRRGFVAKQGGAAMHRAAETLAQNIADMLQEKRG